MKGCAFNVVIQLRELFNVEGQTVKIDDTVSADELSSLGGYEQFASDMRLLGKIANHAGVVTLSYTVSVTLRHLCDRCSEEFEREYSYEQTHTLVTSLEDDGGEYEEDYILCPENALDLTELALSDLRLSLPTKILCRDDCKGLCPECGKNLNEGGCDCGK